MLLLLHFYVSQRIFVRIPFSTIAVDVLIFSLHNAQFYAPVSAKSRRSAIYWMGSLAKFGLTTLSGACGMFTDYVQINDWNPH